MNRDKYDEFNNELMKSTVKKTAQFGNKAIKRLGAAFLKGLAKVIALLAPYFVILGLILLIALMVYSFVFLLPKQIAKDVKDTISTGADKFISIFYTSKYASDWTLDDDLKLYKQYVELVNQSTEGYSTEELRQIEKYKLDVGILASLDRILGDEMINNQFSFKPNPKKHYKLIKPKFNFKKVNENIFTTYRKSRKATKFVESPSGEYVCHNGYYMRYYSYMANIPNANPNARRYNEEKVDVWEDKNNTSSKQSSLLQNADTYKTSINYKYKNVTATIQSKVIVVKDSNSNTLYRFEGSENKAFAIPEKYKKFIPYLKEAIKREKESDIKDYIITIDTVILEGKEEVGKPYSELVQLLNDYDMYSEMNLETIVHMANNYNTEGEYNFGDIGNFNAYGKIDFNPDIPIIDGDFTREDILNLATSMLDLPYFWGGKYLGKGCHPDWGSLKIVTAPGFDFTGGPAIPYGLDCSGFTQWVYYNVTGVNIGISTFDQWANTYSISEEELKVGDLGFYAYGGTTHVGIYIGQNDGTQLFLHCGGPTWKSSSCPAGRVVISYNNSWKVYKGNIPTNFRYFRRAYVDFKND